MVYSILPVPFADAARQQQYEALHAALAAEAAGPATVLLGHLEAFAPFAADALLVRPDCLALVVLTPRGGHLTIPTLAYGGWQLDGQPVPGRADADNPFAQVREQQPAALDWLAEQLACSLDELPPCLGLALFEAPLTFGPGVEAQLHQQAEQVDFELVAGVAHVPERLRQLALQTQPSLAEPTLLAWADKLTAELTEAEEPTIGLPLGANYLEQKLRQLWRWLGAEDIPADPPYGSAPVPDPYLRDQQEQARLQQLRRELQAELHQQRQEAAAREATRTQELTQLRQQLAQAGPSADERRAEQQAQAALEESLRTARAELAARNQELDARIQQLGQLIEQLQAAPAPTPPAPSELRAGPAPLLPAQPAMRQPTSFRRLRQAERWGLVALALAGCGWGAIRLLHPVAPRAAATLSPQVVGALPDRPDAEELPADSLLIVPATSLDSVTTAEPAKEPEAEPTATPAVDDAPAATEPASLPAPSASPEPEQPAPRPTELAPDSTSPTP